MEPHEIIAAPYTIYVAPTTTPFPAIDDLEAAFDADWLKLGKSGAKNYDEAGVTASHEQSLEYFRGADSTVPRKAFRTEEDLLFALSLVDLSPEMYAAMMNDAVITTVAAGAGVAGEKSFSLYRGVNVAQFALLARGMSPVDNALFAQYEAPTVIEDANQAPVYTKGTPAMLELQFRAMDAAGDGDSYGVLRVGTAVAV